MACKNKPILFVSSSKRQETHPAVSRTEQTGYDEEIAEARCRLDLLQEQTLISPPWRKEC